MVLADSVLRTPLLRQLSNSVGLLKSRLAGCRRAFFTVCLFVVALCIVGMHELSLNNELAAPTPLSASAAAPPDAMHQHDAHNQVTSGRISDPAATNPHNVAFSATQGLMMVDTPNDGSGGHQQGCPGCASHTMAFGACLLALTLLVLSWWLAPPRVRLLPPRLPARLVMVVALVGQRVPALSLAELSILRT